MFNKTQELKQLIFDDVIAIVEEKLAAHRIKENTNAQIRTDCPGPQPETRAHGGYAAEPISGRFADHPGVATPRGSEASGQKPHQLGEARAYETSLNGAMRESIGTKIRTHLVPYELTVAAAVGLNYGESKYAARNFEKGLSMLDLLGSIERHTKAMMDGEDIDDDSMLPHYVLLASSVAMLCHNIMQACYVEDRPVAKLGVSVSMVAKAAAHMQNSAARLREDLT